LAKEVGNASIAGTGKTCPNGRSEEDEYSSTEESGARTKDRAAKKGPLCNGSG